MEKDLPLGTMEKGLRRGITAMENAHQLCIFSKGINNICHIWKQTEMTLSTRDQKRQNDAQFDKKNSKLSIYA